MMVDTLSLVKVIQSSVFPGFPMAGMFVRTRSNVLILNRFLFYFDMLHFWDLLIKSFNKSIIIYLVYKSNSVKVLRTESLALCKWLFYKHYKTELHSHSKS